MAGIFSTPPRTGGAPSLTQSNMMEAMLAQWEAEQERRRQRDQNLVGAISAGSNIYNAVKGTEKGDDTENAISSALRNMDLTKAKTAVDLAGASDLGGGFAPGFTGMGTFAGTTPAAAGGVPAASNLGGAFAPGVKGMGVFSGTTPAAATAAQAMPGAKAAGMFGGGVGGGMSSSPVASALGAAGPYGLLALGAAGGWYGMKSPGGKRLMKGITGGIGDAMDSIRENLNPFKWF